MTSLQDLLERADFISLNCDLNPTSRQLINADSLVWMKPTAVLINTARGSVVCEPDLVEALTEGIITGAALDVFEEEPLPAHSPLRKLNNVILTPHMAGEPDGLYFHAKRLKFFYENIQRVAHGKAPKYVLNKL